MTGPDARPFARSRWRHHYGAPATERTEAWVLFDRDTLYVAARCWDSEPPERWVANELRRDTSQLRQNDTFGVILDTFYDRRNGYLFYTNPLGARADQAVTDERTLNVASGPSPRSGIERSSSRPATCSGSEPMRTCGAAAATGGIRPAQPPKEEADAYARQPEKIANKVYANRMGNRGETSGDGWKYRGRGLIQLTGRSNYKAFAQWVGDERVVDEPDLVSSEYAVQCAVFFWDKNNLNRLADKDDVVGLTKKINGGANGLAHRRELLNKATGLLTMLGLGSTTVA